MKFSKFILLTLTLSSFALTCLGQKDCELRKSDDNIFVYACKTTDSKIKSIRSTFSVETSASILAAHILDVENYPSWQYRMKETQVLERVSEHEFVYRSEMQAPWPVSNRDLIIRMKISQDKVTGVMTIVAESEADFFPKKDGVVRVPRSEARWVVTPVAENNLRVEYSFLVDPGGSIPGWLVNLTIAEGPYKTFQNLISRIGSGTPARSLSFIHN